MAALTPSLAGLSLKPVARPRVPTGADDDDDRDAMHRKIFGDDDSDVEEIDPPPPPAPMRAPAATGPVLPLARGGAGPSMTDWVAQAAAKREELKRKAEEALAAADEVKRQKAEVKAAEKAAAAEAKAAAKAQADAVKAAAKAQADAAKAAAKAEADAAKAAAKAEADAAKAAAKAEVDAAKAAAKAAADEAKAAEKAAAAAAKAEVDAAKAAAKAAADEAKAAEKAAADEAKAARERAKAEEDAMDQAEADAEGISVKTLKARRTKALKVANEAGYATVAEYQEVLVAAEAEAKAKAEEAAAAQAAAEAAAKAAEEAEAKRQEQEEACKDLEEQIHRLRWQQRSMAEDYAQMLKEWEENNCGDPPAWMGELSAIFQKLSGAIQDAEDKDPQKWEVSEGGKHAQYADKFADEAENEAMEVDGEEGEEGEGEDDDEPPEGYTVKDEASNALVQGKAKGRGKNDDDEDMDVEDDTLQIDLRVIVQNVRDDSEEKEKWRTQVIHTDYDNLPMSGAKYVSVPDPDSKLQGATKLVRADKEQTPYPSDIPQAYIDDLHAEVIGIERAVRGLTTSILGEAATPQSLLDSVAVSPMTAYDSTNSVTQQNLGFIKGKGMLLTQYAVTMELPSNDEANRAKAGALIEGLVTLATEKWSDVTGLRVKTVSGVQDKDSYMMGMLRMQKAKRDDPPNAEEKQFLAEKFGPNWYKAEGGVRPDDLMDALEWFRKMMKDMDQQERIDKMIAEQRKVGSDAAAAAAVQDMDQSMGGGGGGGGGGRRKPGKGTVQRRDV